MALAGGSVCCIIRIWQCGVHTTMQLMVDMYRHVGKWTRFVPLLPTVRLAKVVTVTLFNLVPGRYYHICNISVL